MLAPSESLSVLEHRLTDALLAFERLDDAWPKGSTAIERAEIGRRRSIALLDVETLQQRILRAQGRHPGRCGRAAPAPGGPGGRGRGAEPAPLVRGAGRAAVGRLRTGRGRAGGGCGLGAEPRDGQPTSTGGTVSV